ncbi:MAG: regulatory protein NosR [Gammaproteobacteria bacterium]|nr:regulatory protein NosR [Gammaproteobacteria bacterium]
MTPFLKKLILCFFLLSLMTTSQFSHALFVSPAKAPEPFITAAFPGADPLTEKNSELPYWTITKFGETIGYAFETNDIARIPAYSGEPVNSLVLMDATGTFIGVKVLEHHEPILLVGLPEKLLFEFADQYQGLTVFDRVKVGGRASDGQVNIDAVSGATVTVMVVNVAVMKAARIVAQHIGLITKTAGANLPPSTIKQELYQSSDWLTLTGDGSIRKLYLNRKLVDQAFVDTEAEFVDNAEPDEKNDDFIELYYAQLNIPTIGRNLLGDSEYQWLMDTLKPDEHAIIMMANGYSFKGSGYVRGGIFDRIQLHQKENSVSFRDTDQYRVNDIFIMGAPRLKEMSIFIIRDHHEFDPGSAWQIELLVRRQTGPLDSVFTSFQAEYNLPDRFITRPIPPIVEPELALWQQVWLDRQISIMILVTSLVILTMVLFFQDILVRHPVFYQRFRAIFLTYVVIFIGWSEFGQLSIVNVFTFLQTLMGNFKWDLFLLDPMLFILWGFVAMSIMLWGRGVFCGWLCPFGALQELINEAARKLKIKQYELPFAVHERLWAIKYIILLALFGLSLDSMAVAEQFAEVEPFKTTYLLHFDRQWPFVIYAVILLVVNIFTRKVYCRYICPLGAALAIPSGMRLFDWLKRRHECGPCNTCAVECEIQAIHPDGTINLRECHYCLDCQVTYYDDKKCPPLMKMARKRRRKIPSNEQTIDIKQVG